MKKSLFLVLSATSLMACSIVPHSETSSSTGSADRNTVTWATPTGAPTIAFYDQGANENWLSSSNPASDVLPHFGDNNFDALVFDATQGLNNIKANNRNYKLAKWIGEGTFYVVSLIHDADYVPQSQPTVMSFMPSGNASVAFRDLAKNVWNWGEYSASSDEHIHYGAAVSNVQATLNNIAEAGSIDANRYDYYVLAQPVFAAMKAKFATKGLPFYLVKDLQAEFAAAHDGAKIPAAAIFVNNASYASKKEDIDAWLAHVDENLEAVAADLSVAKNAIAAFDDAGTGTNSRFGFLSNALNVMKAQSGGNSNPMNLLPNSKMGTLTKADIANGYQAALGLQAFDSTLFLD